MQFKEPLDTLCITTEKFTEVEVGKAIKALKNNKSPCMDGISAEMLTARGERVVQGMCGLCNQVWETDVPNGWKNGTIVCIPKKGKLNDCDNWGRVTLLSTPGKVYYQMIMNDMYVMVDAQLCEKQAGFRPNGHV